MRCRFLFSAIVSGVLLCSPWLAGTAISVQGWGQWATGGQDKPPRTVTNLLPSGTGSLRQALLDSAGGVGGYITFAPGVGGVIDLSGSSELVIPSYVTIAGETASDNNPDVPPGITIYGAPTRILNAYNVIVRQVRFRDKDRNRPDRNWPMSEDTFEIHNSENVAVHHCSMAWGNDGTLDISKSRYVTVEFCIIAEALEPHSLAMLVKNMPNSSGNITIHSNLFVSNNERNPFIVSDASSPSYYNHVEFYNNLVFNWGNDGTHFDKFNPAKANIAGNYYLPTSSSNKPFAIYVRNGSTAWVNGVNGNFFANDANIKWEQPSSINSATPIMNPTVTPFDPPTFTYGYVLNNVGPGSGLRDVTDQRLINEASGVQGYIPSIKSDLVAAHFPRLGCCW